MPPIKILIVDDHAMFRTGLNQILRLEPWVQVVGEAVDGYDAVSKALELNPDLILMDFNMPVCDGLKAMTLLREKLPGVKALFMIVSKEEEELYRELSHGAQDYILKSANVKDLMEAVSRAAAGEKIIPESKFRLTAS